MTRLVGKLGAQLLLRNRNGVVQTEAGKAAYRHTRTVLRHIEHIREEIATPGAMEVGLVVAATQSQGTG